MFRVQCFSNATPARSVDMPFFESHLWSLIRTPCSTMILNYYDITMRMGFSIISTALDFPVRLKLKLMNVNCSSFGLCKNNSIFPLPVLSVQDTRSTRGLSMNAWCHFPGSNLKFIYAKYHDYGGHYCLGKCLRTKWLTTRKVVVTIYEGFEKNNNRYYVSSK